MMASLCMDTDASGASSVSNNSLSRLPTYFAVTDRLVRDSPHSFSCASILFSSFVLTRTQIEAQDHIRKLKKSKLIPSKTKAKLSSSLTSIAFGCSELAAAESKLSAQGPAPAGSAAAPAPKPAPAPVAPAAEALVWRFRAPQQPCNTCLRASPPLPCLCCTGFVAAL